MSKQKILAKLDTFLPKAGGTMSGALTLNSDPTNNLEAATKQYADTHGVTYAASADIATLLNSVGLTTES